jgi:hypothetical protein
MHNDRQQIRNFDFHARRLTSQTDEKGKSHVHDQQNRAFRCNYSHHCFCHHGKHCFRQRARRRLHPVQLKPIIACPMHVGWLVTVVREDHLKAGATLTLVKAP